MRGVELPDSTKPFKFDVDLSEFTVNGKMHLVILRLYYIECVKIKEMAMQ